MCVLATSPNAGSELEQARPQTSGEEELQLQLALAMSREAAEQVRTRTHTRVLTVIKNLEKSWKFKMLIPGPGKVMENNIFPKVMEM